MLLDTSFLVDFLRGKKEAHKKLAEIEAEHSLTTTEINVLELYKGVYLSNNFARNLEMLTELLESLTVFKIEPACYNIFGSLSANLHSRGKHIGDFDELIAAIALLNDEIVLTRDKHFNEIADLKVENY